MQVTDDRDPSELFDLLNIVGQGSYGTVWKALSRIDASVVAVKIMSCEADTTELEKEIDLLRKCDSQQIVKYVGAWRKDDDLWVSVIFYS
jgi:serine/threonine protein kinase